MLHRARSNFQLRDAGSKSRITFFAKPANDSPIMLGRFLILFQILRFFRWLPRRLTGALLTVRNHSLNRIAVVKRLPLSVAALGTEVGSCFWTHLPL